VSSNINFPRPSSLTENSWNAHAYGRMTPTEEELKAMVEELDADGSGDIDLEVGSP